MASYPNSLSNLKTDFNANNTPSVEGHTASGHNQPNDEINAVQAELGTNPRSAAEEAPASSATKVVNLLGQFKRAIKNIKGTTNWYDSVADTLSSLTSTISTRFDAFTGHKHTGATNDAPRVQTEGDNDYVVSGGVWSADDLTNDLLASMTAIVAYIGGQRITANAVVARAFTASKFTAIDLGVDGTIDYSEGATRDAMPTLAADHVRLAVIVSDGSATTQIIDRRNLSPDNLAQAELLEGAADNMWVESLPNRKFLKMLVVLIPSGAINEKITFNSDTGANYTRRSSTNGAADVVATGQTLLSTGSATTATLKLVEIYIVNIANQEKLVISHNIDANVTGTGVAPQRREMVGKWANTAGSINRVDMDNDQAGSYASGSKIIVSGHN